MTIPRITLKLTITVAKQTRGHLKIRKNNRDTHVQSKTT